MKSFDHMEKITSEQHQQQAQQQQQQQRHAEICMKSSYVISMTTTADDEHHQSCSILTRAMSVLTRFHAGYFRISLALSGQALLWKTLTEPSMDPHALRPVVHALPSVAFLLLWSLSLTVLAALCALYALRCLLRFPRIHAEFRHDVGVNYLFSPFISGLLLLQSTPLAVPALHPRTPTYHLLWLVFSIPILALDVKVYGQWFTKGKRFLSAVANPASQMTVIGNLVGARAAAGMGWRESAVGMFAVGMAHYMVLLVTLYQRHRGGEALPAVLRPVLFLFFAAPGMASLAWKAITEGFDVPCRMLFFLSLFLFASLACRPTLFKKSMQRFNVAWWAYSFPLTVLALAAIEYAQEVRNEISNALMLVLTVLSVLVTFALMLFAALKPANLLPCNDPFELLRI